MEKKTELDFVDKDIAEYFNARWPTRDGLPGDSFWDAGRAVDMQLARNVERLAKAIDNLTRTIAETSERQP